MLTSAGSLWGLSIPSPGLRAVISRVGAVPCVSGLVKEPPPHAPRRDEVLGDCVCMLMCFSWILCRGRSGWTCDSVAGVSTEDTVVEAGGGPGGTDTETVTLCKISPLCAQF